MEQTRGDVESSEQGSFNALWWPSELVTKLGDVSLGSREEAFSHESPKIVDLDASSSKGASQILWSTGMLSKPIPNGFYSILLDKRQKELFDTIPSLDELHALGEQGFKADVILVDFQKDKKLIRLKQLITTLVKGLHSNPAAIIKKLAGLVSEFYKRPILDSPAKAPLEENAQLFENCGAQLLGQVKHGTCHARAILFKVLADTVGLECKLLVGMQNDRTIEGGDYYKHASVMVSLNSVELLVDLMRFPGQLIPRSTKASLMNHISAAGESDSAENDSCDSPMEPNSPLYCGHPDRVDPDSVEKEEGLQFYSKLEGSPNLSGPSLLRSSTTRERNISFSHSEPNIATAFWCRSKRRFIAEQRTASPSPEHPLFRSRGRSLLSGDRDSNRDCGHDRAPTSCRSDGASTSGNRRTRRRSVSITPEVGDDIVRAVRAKNESLKQNLLLQEQRGGDRPGSQKNVSAFNHAGHNHMPGRSSAYYSLPSSPHNHGSVSYEESGVSNHAANNTWNKVLESLMFQNKPLLPYQEWNIEFSELTFGTRVGIGFFGEVFRGIWNGTDVAIKVLLEQDLTEENIEDFCNEVSILSRLRHPNVILFMGACTRPPRLLMVTEYMERGSLYYLIHRSGQKKKLGWHRRLNMLQDICRGLMSMHRMKIVHRDLKSANCLVNKHWMVKICDFGLSRIMADTAMKEVSSAGTPEWMAPELIRNEPPTEKCDIFSLGVIMWELCTLRRPWEGVPPERVVYAVANEGSRLDIPEGPLGRLITDCWAEPQGRPSCEDILSRLRDCEDILSQLHDCEYSLS